MTTLQRLTAAAMLVVLVAGMATLRAQRGGGAGGGGSARASAPIDLTGYWVSVITEDWKFRMVTPRKGVYETLTLNAQGRKVADGWDAARDEASGESCRAYSAANIMRMPTRLNVTWADDRTLRIDTDAGTQTRLLRFGTTAVTAPAAGAPAVAAASWQGQSAAEWQFGPGRGASRGGSMKVITTGLRPGYIRRNGAPHSDRATVTEYFDLNTAPNGDQWLTVTTKVDDPVYFTRPYLTSSDFKKLRDNSGWNPTPCSAR